MELRLIIFPGVNMETPPDALEAAFDAGCDAGLLRYSSRFRPRRTCVRSEIANERGVTTVLDAGPATKNGLDGLPPVTILSPNETETRALVDIYPRTRSPAGRQPTAAEEERLPLCRVETR